MADVLTIAADELNASNTTLFTGACQLPGDQSTHILTLTIWQNGTEITGNYTITGPTLTPGGTWNAEVTPAVPMLSSITVKISCTFDGNSATNTTMTMSQAAIID